MFILVLLRVVSLYLAGREGSHAMFTPSARLRGRRPVPAEPLLSVPGEERPALPLADGWHHFFAKRFGRHDNDLAGVSSPTQSPCAAPVRSTGHLSSLSATL